MRLTSLLCLFLFISLTSGCGSSSREPVFAGKLEGGTFWKNPLTAPNNEGRGYDKGSRVEVYDQFVVVTTPDGISHLHPHGCYSGLLIKKD